MAANLSVSCYGDGKLDKVETQFSSDMAEVSEWSELSVSLKQGTNCQLSLQVTRGDGTDGAMAIGAIRVQSGKAHVFRSSRSLSPHFISFLSKRTRKLRVFKSTRHHVSVIVALCS